MKTATLEFEEYPGEEVVVRLSGIPVREFIALNEQWLALKWDADELEAISTAFAPYLLSWTLDTPISEGVFGHHLGLGIGIIREWIKAVRDVPLPLSPRSSDGTPSEDRSPTSSPEPPSSTE